MKWSIGSIIRFDWLEKLANHLKTGKLSYDNFNFTDYKRCALRECIVLWPERWHLNTAGEPVLIKSNNDKPYSCGREFFNLDTVPYDHLFVPTMQKPELFGGQLLDDNATREQVADNIIAFCNKLKQEEKR